MSITEEIELGSAHIYSRNPNGAKADSVTPAGEEPCTLEQDRTEESVIEFQATSDVNSSYTTNDTHTRIKNLQPYTVLVGSFLGLIVNLGLINSIGAVQSYVSVHQFSGYSASTVSWIFSIYLALAYAGALVSGPLFDSKGTLWLLIYSTLFIFAGLMGAANSFQIWHFVLSFISLGIGNGLGMAPLVSVIGHWFSPKIKNSSNTMVDDDKLEKFEGMNTKLGVGVSTGLATAGGSIGGLVFPLMLRKLYLSVGFVWALRILAFTCLGCMICSIVLVKERFRKEKKTSTVQLSEWPSKFINFCKIKDTRFLFIICGGFCTELSLVLLVTYFASYAIAHGMSESDSLVLITIWNGVGTLGRFLPGLASDYFGRFNINVIMLVGYCLTILVLLLPFGNNHKILYAFSVLGGVFSGSILSLLPVCLSQISKANELGKKYGILNFYLSLANLFGIPIAAAIIKHGTAHDYDNFIIFVGCLSVVGLIFWVLARVSLVGIKLNVRV
ncbi:hypothetical protein KGF57_005182 [Candida theae]|uniref:Major facilitator superfamily (MFS) profile domain-containing protein n=1 Tax=Candida theae TaxID=1198502 RepID=A0AAD5BAN0_9ASCO|nr:uncharacterized protein KGF57_005182 [Candida theae]KAI5948784.1 hypothetical protein KGF57_005182 [Candida theae]